VATDRGAGIDPLSLVIGYKQALLLAALYDPATGLILWPLDGAPQIGLGKTSLVAIASDYQESKNLDQAGNVLPNSSFLSVRLRAVARPTLTWLLPRPRACAARREPLFVIAGALHKVRSVRFFDGKRPLGTVKSGAEGLYSLTWRTAKAKRGRHVLRALVTDRRGATVAASRVARVCR
jgi:hypothetical protein